MEQDSTSQTSHGTPLHKKWWFWVILCIMLFFLLVAGGCAALIISAGNAVDEAKDKINNATLNNANADSAEDVVYEYVEVARFSGTGNSDTESFSLTGTKVKMVGKTSGATPGIGSYSGIDLESEAGNYISGADLTLSTDDAEIEAETIIRDIDAGQYFVSVISGVDWEVVIYEERAVE